MNYSNAGISKYVKAILIGAGVGTLVCAILLLIITFVLTSTKSLPDSILSTVALVIGVFGAFTGGYVSVRIAKCRGMLLGAVCGILMFLIVFLVGISNSTDAVGIAAAIKGVAMTCASSIGGIFAVNKKQKIR